MADKEMTPALAASVLKFLTEAGLTKTAKAFGKESGFEADADAVNLCEVFRHFEEQRAAGTGKRKEKAPKAEEPKAEEGDGSAPTEDAEEPPKKKAKKEKKEKVEEVVEEAAEEVAGEAPKKEKKSKKEKKEKAEEVVEEAVEEAAEEAPKKEKKSKKEKKEKKEKVEVVEEAAEEVVEEAPKKEKKKKEKKEKAEEVVEEAAEEVAEEAAEEAPKESKKDKKRQNGQVEHFSRIDDAKWREKLGNNTKLIDNSHEAKARFGGSKGDSWGDKAAADMIKVRGKGFRKEMQKKKKASWRGGGELDQGVNSVPFDSDSD